MMMKSTQTQTLRPDCSKADPQTNTQTGTITIHCAAQRAQCNNNNTKEITAGMNSEKATALEEFYVQIYSRNEPGL